MKAWWMALLVAGGLGCGSESAGPRQASSVQQAETGDNRGGGERFVAQQAAEKLLAPLLVAPSTAVYPWEEIQSAEVPEAGPGRAWRVQGVVEAKNALGVPLRHKWEAFVVEREETLFPIYLAMEGRVVFGSREALVEAGIKAEGKEEPAPESKAIPTPPAEMREWTDASGQFRIQARFGGMAFGKVRLERTDGQVIEIAAEKLSEEDREWILSRR
ncbi:MAG: hypothetical protein GX547_16295 [Phycisphaerae bacterium]|nr:hypothetical protein [Phycisphaerae bacterium]